MAEPDALPSRKREKPILSCAFCRGRKLRCDRQTPCGACERRGKAMECSYSASEQERTRAVDYRPHARRQQARQRVARLEDLVTEMRDRVQSMPGSAAADSQARPTMASPSSAAKDMGKLSLTDDLAVYTGSSHWVTILEDIQRLKDELSEDQPPDAADPDPGLSLDADALMARSSATRISLLSSGPTLPRDQILSMVPLRDIVDKHVSNFFSHFDMAPFVLHRGKFLSEYTRFWDNPASVPVMWLGLLFSVMSISSFLAGQHQRQTPGGSLGLATTENTVQTYRAMTIHCLVAGDYMRPLEYTIETLILHFSIDQMHIVDGIAPSWVLMGVIVRLALRMGLHRDPSHWPSIRPLQAELRRRLWICLYQMDFFTSVQVGLPRLIKDAQCDTQPPSHLASQELDQDLDIAQQVAIDKTSTTEPAPTPPFFIVQRNGIIEIAAKIYDATEERPGPSLATLSSLTAQLETAIGRIPAAFTYTSFESSIGDGAIVTLHRVVLDMLIQKTVYLLHRRSFVAGDGGNNANNTSGDMFASQDKSIRAALSILKHQERISPETLPGGLLFDIRWKVTASLNHEVLQATMMLCFALSSFDSSRPRTDPSSVVDGGLRAEISDALTRVKEQWESKAEQSAETQKALHAITTVLQRNQQARKSEEELQSQTFPVFGGAESALPPSSTVPDLFDPLLAIPSQEYFDFNVFDYGGSIDPETIDPLLFDAGFGYDESGSVGQDH